MRPGDTDRSSGAHASTTPPCSIPTSAAAMARPVSTAGTPAGLASMSRSMPNSRSYTVPIAVNIAAEERRHGHDARKDEGLVGQSAFQPGDRVVARADQQQPHERPCQAAEQAAGLPRRAREVTGDDAVDRAPGAHPWASRPSVSPPFGDGPSPAPRVRAKYTSSRLAGRRASRSIPGAARGQLHDRFAFAGNAHPVAALGAKHGGGDSQAAKRPRQPVRARTLDLRDLRPDGRSEARTARRWRRRCPRESRTTRSAGSASAR